MNDIICQSWRSHVCVAATNQAITGRDRLNELTQQNGPFSCFFTPSYSIFVAPEYRRQ